MNQYDMCGFDLFDELCGLLAISMCGKADLVDVEIDCDGSIAFHTFNKISLFEVIGNGSFCAISGNDDAITGIMTPSFQ